MNETPGTLRTLLARRDGELVAIEPWVIAWEADIAKREALEKMMASQDELNHNLVDRNEALERAMSAIECCKGGHDLLPCPCQLPIGSTQWYRPWNQRRPVSWA